MRLNNLFLPLLIISVILISGCINKGGQTATNEQINEQNNEPVPPPPPSEGEVKEFNIIAKQWEFSPSRIEVNKGDKVILHIKSIDVTHGFGLPAFGINEVLEPGKTVDVEFVADKTGTFSFLCTVYCGAGHSGMKGELIVR